MIEDYVSKILLLVSGLFWLKECKTAKMWMIAAWGYATDGMFVPFFAHFEAYLRGETFRPDHPHEDVGSVIFKGSILAICLIPFIISLRHKEDNEPASS